MSSLWPLLTFPCVTIRDFVFKLKTDTSLLKVQYKVRATAKVNTDTVLTQVKLVNESFINLLFVLSFIHFVIIVCL